MLILECVRAVTTSSVSRLHWNKMSAWNLAMREEKEWVSTNLRRPRAGSGYMGRLGFMGEYAKEVAKVYEEKREYNAEKVKEMNKEGRIGTMESLKRVQTGSEAFVRNSKSLDTQIWRYSVLTKQVAYLGNHGIHTVLCVIPTKFPTPALNSAGYGVAHYKLILDSRRCFEECRTMCDGWESCQQAIELLSVPETFEGTAGWDKLPTLVTSATLAIISM